MGLFGFPSRKDIDGYVLECLQQYVGDPTSFGTTEYDDAFDQILRVLDEWADEHTLGNWKRSAIVGSLKSTLRQSLKGYLSSANIDLYVKKSRSVILKM